MTIPSSTCKLYYTLDTNSNDSVGTSNGTVNGASSATGIISNGLELDGINDWFDSNYVPYGTANAPFTINIWVNTVNSSSTQGVFAGYNGTASSYGAWLAYANGNSFFCRLWKGNGTQTNLDFSYTLTANTWYMLSFTYDGTTARSYVNGILQSSAVGTYNAGNTDNIIFGKYRHSDFSNMWQGKLDEPAFWEEELSSTVLLELYNSGAPTTDQQYPFGTVSSGTKVNGILCNKFNGVKI